MEPLKLAVVGVFGFILAAVISRSFSPSERIVANLSVVFHLVAAVAQELVYRLVYGVGDMFSYQYHGAQLARVMDNHFAIGFRGTIDLLLQREHQLPFTIVGQGTSTGSMTALSGLLSYGWSNELYVMGGAIGMFSTTGFLLMYRSVRPVIPVHVRTRAACATLLLPTSVFWSSALLKEAVIMGAVGSLTAALHSATVNRKLVAGLVLGAPSALVIALYKPYILAGFFAASGAFLVAHRATTRGRTLTLTPGKVLAAVLGSALLLVAFGQFFPDYNVADLGEALADEQASTLSVAGGSTYQIVDSSDRSTAAQLAYAPIALVTALFRPFIFEARNALSALNALETTFLLVLFIRAVSANGLRKLLTTLTGTPEFLFLAVFVLVVGVGVGLATTNLGTLSRYRIPMYGQFALLCVVLTARPAPTRPSVPSSRHFAEPVLQRRGLP